MASHRIQLKGPWEYDWRPHIDQFTDRSTLSGTTTMPKEWRELFGGSEGTAEFRRKFHRPTNLEPHERLYLVFSGIGGRGSIFLNERDLAAVAGTESHWEIEISGLLKPFNVLRVELRFDPSIEPASPGGLYGVVAIDIRTVSERPN